MDGFLSLYGFCGGTRADSWISVAALLVAARFSAYNSDDTMAKTLYDKPVRELMRDMVSALEISPSDTISRDEVKSWFREHYPKIKDGTIAAHLLLMSTNAKSRIHHNPKQGQDDLFYQIDSSLFRLYRPDEDPTPIYERGSSEKEDDEVDESEVVSENQFAYEKDLQNFLARNLDAIEPELSLFEDDGITGVEFPVGGRFIDILARDKNDSWVVIELKVSRGYDRVVGQLLRYMAWIRQNQAEGNEKVRGIIVAREISTDLALACSEIADVELFEYQLSVKLRQVPK